MEKYIASCVVQLKNRKGKPFQARLRYPDASKKKGWSEISRMVPEEIKSKRDAGKWAEKWRAEMNAVADNMPSMEANKTISEVFMEFLNHQLNTGEIEKSTYNNSYYYFREYIEPYLRQEYNLINEK